MFVGDGERNSCNLKNVFLIICNQNYINSLGRLFCIQVFISVDNPLEIQMFKIMKIKGLLLWFEYKLLLQFRLSFGHLKEKRLKWNIINRCWKQKCMLALYDCFVINAFKMNSSKYLTLTSLHYLPQRLQDLRQYSAVVGSAHINCKAAGFRQSSTVSPEHAVLTVTVTTHI